MTLTAASSGRAGTNRRSERGSAADRTSIARRARAACARIHAQLNHGAPWDACDTFREAIAVDPGDAELLYCGALAHARVGASERAYELLDQAQQASPPATIVPEIMSLRGRLWKDRAQSSRAGSRAASVAMAHARTEYLGAYALAHGAYPGVNVATLSMLLGDRRNARRLAREVIASLATQTRPLTCWDHATRGEAELLLGHPGPAKRCYAQACALASGDAGVVATMRRQVMLLANVMPHATEVLPAMPATDVLAFVGHMIDAPGVAEPRFPPALEPAVSAAIRARLARLMKPIVYSSAACGADLAFIEAALDIGAEVNIVLPFDRVEFARTSVAIGGAAWVPRYQRALARATRVIMATEEGHLGDDVLYEYAATILEGLAMLRAAQLEVAPTLLAVIDTKSKGRVGGTRASFERWKRTAGTLELIDLRSLREASGATARVKGGALQATPRVPRRSATAISPAGLDATPTLVGATRPQRGLKTMLFADFAGYSRLHDAFAPLFQHRFLEIGAQQVASSKTPPLEVKTWGDALYGVFEAPRDGAEFALGLLTQMQREDWTVAGLPDTSRIRIALHAGPVFLGFDPVMQRHSYFGANVTRAARIEPITPPGMIYVSEAFAGTLVASGERGYRLEYIGMLALAKAYGESRIYRLQRGARRGANR
ncbi:MAG: adenylate/guanylate cyclase domain-containing protein [Casimicrobiaceae bacterium]